MLSSVPQRKAKITLSDYSYRRDIENRIVMAHLTVFEVKVLHEIIHHSLNISIEQFAKELKVKIDFLIPILDRLGATKLFKRHGSTLIVDKEIRKYFEFQLEKFDDNFQPNLDFLQNVLSKVPIHVLPIWYAIPRSSDNIFASIIEKYFLTPKTYRQYLQELQFDHPVLHAIIQDVYEAPDFKITATELIKKHRLSRESFEEYLLLLEYHFACCLTYNRVDDEWQEVVTPFSEWLEYLQFETQTKPIVIKGSIERSYFSEFNFIQDLNTVLQECQRKKILLKDVKNLRASTAQQRQSVADKLLQVQFIQQHPKGQFSATEKGKSWASKPLPEQIVNLSTDSLNALSSDSKFSNLWNVRNLHLIEKSLRRLVPNEWVEIHQFLEGFTASIGDREPITLKNKGKKWKYLLPHYTNLEKQFIQEVIMERLAQLGIVNTGKFQGKSCFCLTSFGNYFIQ